MIPNAYAILDAFVTLMRLGVGLLVIGLALSLRRGWRRAPDADAREALERRGYLVSMLALLLVLLNVASWPLLYLLLDSYVPEWPGVMCIYGVTRVGAGSDGPSRFLPRLLQALQIAKPLLVFGSGAWGMLYLANRHAPNAPLTGRVLLSLAALGLLGTFDSVAEGAYLLIPKKETSLSDGCCTTPTNDPVRYLPSAVVGEAARPWLWGAYCAANGGMILGLLSYLGRTAGRIARPGLALLLAGSAAALAVSAVFLIDVAAPALLRLPHHHCAYDLLPRAPESLLAVASFAAGTFAVGWACVGAWFADCPETRPFLAEQTRMTLVVALFGYLGSVVMMAVELALA